MSVSDVSEVAAPQTSGKSRASQEPAARVAPPVPRMIEAPPDPQAQRGAQSRTNQAASRDPAAAKVSTAQGGAASASNDPAYLVPIRAYWGRYIEIGLASLIINAFALATPLFSMLVYDKVVGNQITDTLWALATGMLLFAALDFVLRAIRGYYVEQIAIRSDAGLDGLLLQRLLQGDIGKTPPVGAVLSSYRELRASREFLSAQSIVVVADLPFTVLYLVCLFAIGGSIVAAPLAVGTGLVIMQALFAYPTRDYHKLSHASESAKLGLLGEVLNNAEVCASTSLSASLRERWGVLSEQHAVAAGKGRFWSSLSASLAMSSSTVVYVVTILGGVFLIEAQSMTMGGLVASSMLASRALANIAQAVTLGAKFQQLRAAHSALNKLIDLNARDDGKASPQPPVKRRIFVRGVSHRFRREGLLALDSVGLGIEPGERVGIVGRPGSGKSTLVRALAGVIHPSTGDVLVDGVPVRNYKPEDRAQWLVYKPQDAMLFAGTLEDNVRAGNTAATSDELMQALAGVGLAEAIRHGELSLAHEIAPYGTNVSGGQRQAIALARALLSKAPVVILDEPTAGFDMASEAHVANYLKQWGQGRTLIIATHSPVLLNALCDRLVVINAGKVAADGPRAKILQG